METGVTVYGGLSHFSMRRSWSLLACVAQRGLTKNTFWTFPHSSVEADRENDTNQFQKGLPKGRKKGSLSQVLHLVIPTIWRSVTSKQIHRISPGSGSQKALKSARHQPFARKPLVMKTRVTAMRR